MTMKNEAIFNSEKELKKFVGENLSKLFGENISWIDNNLEAEFERPMMHPI